jgi:hypothetical protein
MEAELELETFRQRLCYGCNDDVDNAFAVAQVMGNTETKQRCISQDGHQTVKGLFGSILRCCMESN